MKKTNILFTKLIESKNKASHEELDIFFEGLDSVDINEISGEWVVKYICAREAKTFWEKLIKYFPVFKVYSKDFSDMNNVKAWIFRILKIKFYFPGANAILKNINYRGKFSTSMVYKHLPIIDNFRKIDEDTIMGIMEVKGKTALYFYLKKIK